jgi:hypothetical protein
LIALMDAEQYMNSIVNMTEKTDSIVPVCQATLKE